MSENTKTTQWLEAARYLGTAMGRGYGTRQYADKVNRIISEEGPTWLLAEAVCEAFSQSRLTVELGDVRAALRKGQVLAWDREGTPFFISAVTLRGKYKLVYFAEDGTTNEATLSRRKIKANFGGAIVLHDRNRIEDGSARSAAKKNKGWFWPSIKPLFGASRHLALAAIVGNLLAVGVSLFALQVWDRVIPANSTNTLAVLLIGVGVAVFFELVLRLQRASLIDDIGRVIDKSISGRVFSHMMWMKSDARPQSLGTMASQIREINQIREAFSSTMLTAALDLPFVVIFLAVIYMIGGALIVPIIAGIIAIVALGLIAQVPLSKLAKEGLEEASLKNGLIVETVLKSDEIKLQQAEDTMQMRWDRAVDEGNKIANKQRRWRNMLNSSTASLQQLSYVAVVAMGAFAVIRGDLSMGQVIACSILANRAIAPMMQVASVMGAFQSSLIAKRAVDTLMERATDHPTDAHLRRDLRTPTLAVKNMRYNYPDVDDSALVIPKLEIKHGEKVGILGRIGSGKSTLLRMLSGLADPTYGTVLIDGTETTSIHAEDLRNAVGFQSQNASLLRGTVRANLLMARPSATDEEMIKACEVSGAIQMIRSNPRGLDLLINEAGEGLSGGQKQSLLLARTILRDPAVAMFDEPTASMDDQTEAAFIKSIGEWSADKTLLIATHRMRALSVVDRLLVIDNGRVVMDGPKSEVLGQLQANSQTVKDIKKVAA